MIIVICWFGAQEIFLITNIFIILVKTKEEKEQNKRT